MQFFKYLICTYLNIKNKLNLLSDSLKKTIDHNNKNTNKVIFNSESILKNDNSRDIIYNTTLILANNKGINSESFEILINLASCLAITIFFRKKIYYLIKNTFTKYPTKYPHLNRSFLLKLIISNESYEVLSKYKCIEKIQKIINDHQFYMGDFFDLTCFFRKTTVVKIIKNQEEININDIKPNQMFFIDFRFESFNSTKTKQKEYAPMSWPMSWPCLHWPLGRP